MRPTTEQLAWQEAGFGVFFHFGINTFYGREWSDGTLDPRAFAPEEFDAEQWVSVARRAGAKYVVLTAKHHDGFCLWPTDTTAYSVKATPWRDGKADVVGDLAEACRNAGMPLGLYLSPWDRNAECYGDPDAYNAFYVKQLTELCTRYGPLFELWFDGAGSEGRTYDWDAIMAVIDTHQPEAMVFNMGRPTIRWVGNEDGLASDPVTLDVQQTSVSVYTGDLAALRQELYLPPECDVPIRAHWFWQPDDLPTLKSHNHLLAIWYRSVGLGAGLLLNLGPDRRGLIPDEDAQRLFEVADELRDRFAKPIHSTLQHAPGKVTATFPHPVRFDHLELREDLTNGQTIRGYRVLADGVEIASGQTVGIRRWHAFSDVSTSQLTVELAASDSQLTALTAFHTGQTAIPQLEPQPPADPAKSASYVDLSP